MHLTIKKIPNFIIAKIKIMKKLMNYAILFLTIGIFATACKKTECSVAPNISGNWLGKYCGSCTDTASASTNQFWEIKASGELIVHDGYSTPTAPDANKAIGTWTLNGTKFRATYKFITLDVNRTLDGTLTDNFLKMNGSRGENGLTTGNGVFKMTKQ
jgi:hypothetical protein